MPYGIIVITQADIEDGYFWQIGNLLQESLGPIGYCEENVLQLSGDDSEFIIRHSDVPNEMAAETLAVELSDQIVAVALIQGGESEMGNAIAKAALAVFGEEVAMQVLVDDYWQHVGGAIMHTIDQEQVWAWASVLLPPESQYYPNMYR